MFKVGRRYRHKCAKDLDIQILKVSYVGERYTKLRVYYVNMRTSAILTEANITLQTEDFKYWKETNLNLPDCTLETTLTTLDI